MAPERAWLNLEEAGDYFGVSSKSIRNWIATGLLPAHRIGPHLIRIRRVDLEALASRTA